MCESLATVPSSGYDAQESKELEMSSSNKKKRGKPDLVGGECNFLFPVDPPLVINK